MLTFRIGPSNAMQCSGLTAVAIILLTISVTSKGQLANESGIINVGCFQDADNRDLPIVHHGGSLTTRTYCWTYCHSRGYRYFGLQGGEFCTCGNTYGKYRRVPLSECDALKCKGDGKSSCGDGWKNLIFTTGVDRLDTQIAKLGCFKESHSPDLPADLPLQHAADMNRASQHYCWAFCHSKGFLYFGIRSGGWCACGNSYGRYGAAADKSECEAACPISSAGFCGGTHRNLVFTTGVREANKTRFGCFVACNNKPLGLPLIHKSPPGSNSAQYCGHFCVSHGYRYFGLLQRDLCSCGSAASSVYGRVSDAECDQPCGLSTNETCGAANRVEVFDSGAVTFATQTVYLGCYVDNSLSRDLSAIEHNMEGEATKYYCWRLCFERGYRYFGLQVGHWCFCGNAFGRYGRSSKQQCSRECRGDVTTTCGGENRNEIYATGFEDVSTVCLSDSLMEPQTPWASIEIPAGEGFNASQYCLHLCRSKGYKYFKVRSTSLCFCSSLIKYKDQGGSLNWTANCRPDSANHIYATGVEDWETDVIHLGCFADGAERDLPIFHNAEGLATKYYCWKHCYSRGYKYFGMQSRSYCMCGNSYGKYRHLPDSECRIMRCQGDENAWCSDAMKNIIFTTGAVQWGPNVSRVGCFDHYATKQHFPLMHNAGVENRRQYCWHYCHSRGYMYFGLQGGEYCSCGNALGGNQPVNDTECNSRCMGDPSSTCGARFRNEIFTTGLEKWDTKVIRIGCYKDHEYDRDLRILHDFGHLASKYACWNYCKLQNWRYFGLQKGIFCTCGDSYGRHGRQNDYECRLTCPGDGSSTCGGHATNELFSTGLHNWESSVSRLGCFADQSGQRDLPVQLRADTTNSRHTCWHFCSSHGHRYFSMQAGSFCYCGDSYGRYGRVSNGECNLRCPGEAFQTCGGVSRNEVFTTGVESWAQGLSRLGCFHDNPMSPDLPLKFDAGNRLTKQFCWNHCRHRGYRLFGLQNSRMCLCGNSHGRYGRAREEECHERCRGDYTTTCGAEGRSEIYTTGIEDWEKATIRLGCFADNAQHPDMPLAHSMLEHSASKYTCWQLCKSRGYAYFGLQSRSLCLCGNTYGRHGIVTSTDCNEKCSGGDGKICGGNLKNQVFKTGVNYSVEIEASRIGCYVDGVADDRDLPLIHHVPGHMATRYNCHTYCKSKGYKYFGLQAGQWCTCGNSYGRHGAAASTAECSVRCLGDPSVTCGGRMRNEIFRTGL